VDEEMVEAFLTNGSHPAFGERVRLWRTDRAADRFDPDRSKHLVEADSELGDPIPDKESEATFRFLEVRGEVAGHLGDQTMTGLVVTPSRCTTRPSTSMTKRTW
jgi:hypothetical protein